MSNDSAAGPGPRLESGLAEHCNVWAEALRAVATSWRFRVRAGRLGEHSLAGALQLAALFENAARLLEEQSPAAAPPVAEALGSIQEELQRSEERFRLLVDSVTDYAIFILDPEGQIVTWNAGAERINGWRAEEIIGRSFTVFYTPEALERGHPAEELRIATREGRYHEEGWRLRKDGSPIWADVTLTALRDNTGRLRGFAKVTRDLTERKRVEESLQEEQERFQLLVQSVRDYAIFMLDPEGRIATWNEGARRLKGYESEEIIGQHFSRFYTEEDRKRGHPAEELEIARREGLYHEEGWRLRKDGSRFWAGVTLTALYRNGKLVGFAKVTRDLTERMRHEQALQEAVRVRDEFLSIASHELRTPLTSLELQFSSLQRSSTWADERAQSKLATIGRQVDRLTALVESLLDVSRVMAGRFTLELEPVDLGRLLEEVLGRFRAQAAKVGSELVLSLPEGVVGQWDRLRLEQIVTNLLSNALKYGPGKPIEIGVTADADVVTLRVRDYGMGISPGDQARIFERFERAVSQRHFGGLGLGLWIVRQIVLALGGYISVRSQPGQGSEFMVTLPRVAPAPHPSDRHSEGEAFH